MSNRTNKGRGHLNAIFSEVCSKTKDLVGTQISVAEVRERKEASVCAFSSHLLLIPLTDLGNSSCWWIWRKYLPAAGTREKL